ncbi:hypothetical protein ACEZ3G_07865 [Maribacter algicola]|uniref:Uncharacterized protein n=1 Tax=Meishania litoralis TaxID=3434685 RepID=A0ACC7LI04_9FLAO
MKAKIFPAFLIFFLLSASYAFSQNKYEREHRIKKSQFPQVALDFISSDLEQAKRIRYYREIDSAKVSYEAKFQKDRLKYSIEFDENGVFEDVEIEIKLVDIPNDVLAKLNAYLGKTFSKYRILKLQ